MGDKYDKAYAREVHDITKQARIEATLKTFAAAIDAGLTDELGKMGFALIVFEFHAPGIGNYVSNAQRSDMIKSLRETADRLEAKQDIPPAHTTIQ